MSQHSRKHKRDNSPAISGNHLHLSLQKISPFSGNASGSSRVPVNMNRYLSFARSYRCNTPRQQNLTNSLFLFRCADVRNTPYSRIPLPHTPQNSLYTVIPDPLSAACSVVSPTVILKAPLGTREASSNALPVNFCRVSVSVRQLWKAK